MCLAGTVTPEVVVCLLTKPRVDRGVPPGAAESESRDAANRLAMGQGQKAGKVSGWDLSTPRPLTAAAVALCELSVNAAIKRQRRLAAPELHRHVSIPRVHPIPDRWLTPRPVSTKGNIVDSERAPE